MRTQPEPGRPLRWARALVALGARGAAAFVLLRLLSRDLLPPVVVLDAFRPQLLLACLPLLLAALALRLRRDALLLFACIALGAYAHRDAWSSRAPRAATSSDLRVLSWNVAGPLLASEHLARTLARVEADLVVLQEPPADFASYAAAELAALYPVRAFAGEDVRALGVLSRWPLSELRFVEPPAGNPWLEARLDWRGRSISIRGVHLSAWAAVLSRHSSADENLATLLDSLEVGAPSVILGDFNLAPWSPLLDALRERELRDSWPELGLGLGASFPVGGRWRGLPLPPLVRLDQVWVSPEWELLESRVGPDWGSDHLPVRATLRLRP